MHRIEVQVLDIRSWMSGNHAVSQNEEPNLAVEIAHGRIGGIHVLHFLQEIESEEPVVREAIQEIRC